MALKVTDNACMEEWQILAQSWEVTDPQRTLLGMVCASGSEDNELEDGWSVDGALPCAVDDAERARWRCVRTLQAYL